MGEGIKQPRPAAARGADTIQQGEQNRIADAKTDKRCGRQRAHQGVLYGQADGQRMCGNGRQSADKNGGARHAEPKVSFAITGIARLCVQRLNMAR